MTRQPHDQFAKQYLEELLAPLGRVEISREVASEVRQVDIWFVPATLLHTESQVLGLLGQMASASCLLEPFRNPSSAVEVRNCLLKLYSLHGELLRKARREKNSLSEGELPRLWILSPSCSATLLNGFGAKLDSSGNWSEGVYFLPELQRTALVAINQLPATEQTLWLRLLGRGAVQKQAVDELVALPKEHPLRRNILELLANWRINVEGSENLSDEDRELIMNLSPAYLRWRNDTFQEGRQEGTLEGQRIMVENLLEERFGTLDEELSQIVARIMQLPVRERTRLLLQLSREELSERFGEELI
ncbi:hypothetical protein H6F98_14510 [Microcoleus sp. FACHB-SPT15]|uniref:hypothetical protein n=1 Tax=Microcoleus sp. FACHB-SPT15 TaxID=2692830 RepID=UPI00177F53BD|nr:hypothetical protein [Microcoleus sp. FACHB-SPT15]MBD1806659.1 hypothetical protein [Microcoleus sp. FACHB-SPT15]